MSTPAKDKYIIVGTIGAPFGVKGWVKIHAHTDPKKKLLQYDPWYLETEQGWELIKLQDAKWQHAQIVAHFSTIDDRDAAACLTHKKIAVKREQLPETAPDEFYWSDLEGLAVYNLSGELLGTVDHLLETGSHDVMVIKGASPCLIPFAMGKTVTKVDLAAQTMTVDWDEAI